MKVDQEGENSLGGRKGDKPACFVLLLKLPQFVVPLRHVFDTEKLLLIFTFSTAFFFFEE